MDGTARKAANYQQLTKNKNIRTATNERMQTLPVLAAVSLQKY